MKRTGIIALVAIVPVLIIFTFIFGGMFIKMETNPEIIATTASSMGEFYTLNTMNTLIVENDREIESLTEELIEGEVEPSKIEKTANSTLNVTSRRYSFSISIAETEVELEQGEPNSIGSKSAYLTTRTGPKRMTVWTDRENVVPEETIDGG